MVDPARIAPPRQLPPPPPPQQPAGESQAAKDAVAKIKDHLDGTGLLGAQTDGDVRAIRDTLTGLSPADAKAAIADLKKSGTLDKVTEALTDDSALFGSGLSVDDRQRFFADMAGKLDGASLATLSRSFGRIGQGDGTSGGKPDGTSGATYARELGQAIGTHGSAQAKIDFVRALAGDTTAKGHGSQFEPTWFGGTVHEGNAQARAAGEVLATMRGADAQRAFGALDADQQKAVFAAAIGERFSAGNGQGPAGRSEYDTALFGRLTTAAASMPGAHDKAQVFAAGADVLRGERIDNQLGARLVGLDPSGANKACAEMAQGLAKIIDSDPSGVVNDLANFKTPPKGSGDVATWQGSAFAAYAKQMVLNGDGGQAQLGKQMALVAAGPNGAGDRTEAFNQMTDGKYATATGLGYFVGAVSAATKSIESDATKQRELATNIFQSGLSLVDKANVSGPVAAVAKDWLASAITSISGSGSGDIVARLTDAAVPSNGQGYVSADSNALSAFRSAVSTVSTDATP